MTVGGGLAAGPVAPVGGKSAMRTDRSPLMEAGSRRPSARQ